MAGKGYLDIEMIETAALLSALSERAARSLQEELETGEKWYEKSAHMRAMKHLSEALEVMATNPDIHTVKEWLIDHENKRGAEWCEQWGEWFYNTIMQSVMYALFTTGR